MRFLELVALLEQLPLDPGAEVADQRRAGLAEVKVRRQREGGVGPARGEGGGQHQRIEGEG